MSWENEEEEGPALQLGYDLDAYTRALLRADPFLSLWALREKTDEYIRSWNANYGSRVRVDKGSFFAAFAEEAFDLRLRNLRDNLWLGLTGLATVGSLVFWLWRFDVFSGPRGYFGEASFHLLWSIPLGILFLAFLSALLGFMATLALVLILGAGGKWALEHVLGRAEEAHHWGKLWTE